MLGRIWQWVRRDRILAALVVGIVIMVLIVGVLVFNALTPAARPATTSSPNPTKAVVPVAALSPDPRNLTPSPVPPTPTLTNFVNQGRDIAPPTPPGLAP